MPTSRSLLSLNEDVLREILAHLLLDTPRTSRRTAILRTCSLLHGLGLPFLYRVVDLQGTISRRVLIQQWKHLFGPGGLLTEGGRSKKLRSFVHELRLGGSLDGKSVGSQMESRDLKLQKFNLPKCSSLSLSLGEFNISSYSASLISLLPLKKLRAHFGTASGSAHLSTLVLWNPLSERIVDTDSQPPSWSNLHTVVFDTVWLDRTYRGHENIGHEVSLAYWSFEVLVFELDPSAGVDEIEIVSEAFLSPCSKPKSKAKEEGFLRDTRRIEFRLSGEYAGLFEEVFRRRLEEKTGLTMFEKRIASLIVFVEEDGKERRLVEEVQQ